jgi:uncharacterized protein YdaU (DUF1376 family)
MQQEYNDPNARASRSQNGDGGGAGPTTSTPQEPAAAATARLAWYPFYTGDWLSETRGWSLVARAVYHELLNAQWDLGTLPRDPARLRALVAATSREWNTAWPFVAEKFPRVPGGRQNVRLEAYRQDALALRDRRRAASQRAHSARWHGRQPSTGAGDA